MSIKTCDQADGHGQAEPDADGCGQGDQGALQTAVRGGHEMIRAAVGCGQAERNTAGRRGHGDQGALYSAVRRG